MSSSSTTTITYEQLAKLDYVFKRDATSKVKTDGLVSQTVISAANEQISTVPVLRADLLWADSAALTAGPNASGVPARRQTFVPLSDFHDNMTDLRGRSWRTVNTRNWISTEFHPGFATVLYYAPTNTVTPTLVVDAAAFPYVIDYGSGSLTFIGNVPSYLSSGANILYLSGYTYTGSLGVSSSSNALQATAVTTDAISVNIITSSGSNYIDTLNTSFSNINGVDIRAVTASQTGGTINFSGTTLSNVNVIQAAGIVSSSFTPAANATTPNTIQFNGAHLAGISNLTIQGNLVATGNLIVTDTVTTTTDQFSVQNTGTGPALIVNQTGTQHIAQFQDDSNVIFFLADGGQAAFGNFGSASLPMPISSTDIPTAQVVIRNPATQSRTALYVQQDNTTNNVLAVVPSPNATAATAAAAASNVVIDSVGRVGLGTTLPTARLDIRQGTDNTAEGDLVRVSPLNLQSSVPAFSINSQGRVGISTTPTLSSDTDAATLKVQGNIHVDKVILQELSSPSTQSYIHANYATLCNVGTVNANALRTTSHGSAAEPSLALGSNAIGTGLFTATVQGIPDSTPALAIATNSTERLRITPTGRIGIGTTLPGASLDIRATDAVMLPRGSIAERPAAPERGYIRFNTEITQFEGYGAGDTWSTLGGVVSTDKLTSITAELTYGANDSNLRFFTSGLERARIAPDGNVGIGTPSPQAPLHVQGKALADTIDTRTITNSRSTSNAIDFANSIQSNVRRIQVQEITSQYGNASTPITFASHTLSNIAVVNARALDTDGASRTMNASGITLSNLATLRVAKITSDTSPSATVDFDGITLSNVGILRVAKVTTDAASSAIDFSAKTLSNVDTLQATTLQASVLTTASPTTVDLDANRITLSNLDTLRTNRISTNAPTNPLVSIDFDARTLSNVATLRVQSITTDANTNAIDFSAKTLSNIGVLRVNSVTTDDPATTPGINFNQRDLSNVASVKSQHVYTPVLGSGATPSSAIPIDATASVLSNLDTLRVATITSDRTDSTINFSKRILSNIAEVRTPILTTDIADGTTINVSTRSLSNINTMYATTARVAEIGSLSAVAIDFLGSTLSNVDTLNVTTLSSPSIATPINVSGRTLSNVGTLNASTVAISALTPLIQGSPINGSQSTLSNLAEVSTTTLRTTVLTTPASESASTPINVSGKTLSNVDTLSVRTITTDSPSTIPINFAQTTVSNVASLQTSQVYTQSLSTLPNATTSDINVNAKNLSNVLILDTVYITNTTASNTNVVRIPAKTTLNLAKVSSDAAASQGINFTDTSLSNVNTLYARGIQSGIGTSLDFHANVLSNVDTLVVNTIRATSSTANSIINMSAAHLSNVSTVTVDTVVPLSTMGATASINMSGASLSNTNIIYAKSLRGTSNYTGATLSTGASTFIDASSTTLSIPSITTPSLNSDINFNAKILSNVSALRVATITSESTSINFDQRNLSNIAQFQATDLAADTLSVNTLTTLDPVNGTTINVSAKTLSNVGTLSVARITAPNNVINASAITLSNVDTLRVRNIASDTGSVDFQGMSLSNIAVLRTDMLTSRHPSTTTINVDGKILSNVSTLRLATLASDTSTINASAITLSNLDTLRVRRIASDTTTLDIAANTLSNVSTLRVDTITVDNAQGNLNFAANTLSNVRKISPTPGTNGLDLSSSTLSNVAGISSGTGVINLYANTLSNVDILRLTTLTTDSPSANINIDGKSLSNVQTLRTSRVFTSTISTDAAGANINVSGANFSNVETLSAQTVATNTLTTLPGTTAINASGITLSNLDTLSVRAITTTAADANMNFSGKGLSNISTAYVPTLAVATLTTSTSVGSTNSINFSDKSACNVRDLFLNGALRTNNVAPLSGSSIDFGTNDVTGIRNLEISGDFSVQGEFYVINTSTCNTTQLSVDNAGTGPGLLVNQSGTNTIAQFKDDGVTAFLIRDGGQSMFGSYSLGSGSNAASNSAVNALGLPAALVTIDNPGSKAQRGLYIAQSNTSYSPFEVRAVGASSAGTTGERVLLMDTEGRVGIRTSSPAIALDIGSATDAIRLPQGTTAQRPTSPAAGFMRYNTQTQQFEGYGAGNAWGSLGGVQSIDQLTYISASNDSNLRFVTSGTERVRVSPTGYVGIGTTAPRVLLDAAQGTASAGVLVTPIIRAPDGTNGTATSGLNTVSFAQNRVIDVDSLIVRSNIAVLIPGLNTYSNLPTDLVRLDAVTGRILDQYISTNIVRVMNENGLINPSMLPDVDTNRKMLMHTRDRVGVGLRNPQQKLHVHGSQCITSGRLGIGTTTPLSTLEIYDDNGVAAGSPVLRVREAGTSADLLHLVASNSTPVLCANSDCNVAIGKWTADPGTKLDVSGTISASVTVRTPNIIAPGSTSYITADSPILINGYANSLYPGAPSSVTPSNFAGTLSQIGLRVTNNILAPAFLSVSDRRIKNVLPATEVADDLQRVLDIPVHRFTFKESSPSNRPIAGFIAQEVEEHAPFAVHTTTEAIPSILRYATSVSGDGTVVNIPWNDTDVSALAGKRIKVILPDGGIWNGVVAAMEKVDTDHAILRLDPSTPLPSSAIASAGSVFVYGEYVSDFKLLDTERLVPLAFNAIKDLHGQVQNQAKLLAALTARMDAMEASISARN